MAGQHYFGDLRISRGALRSDRRSPGWNLRATEESSRLPCNDIAAPNMSSGPPADGSGSFGRLFALTSLGKDRVKQITTALDCWALVFGCGASGGNAGRANRRGYSTGPVADRTPARAGSHWAAFPDVATGIPSRRENIADRRADFAGEPGSLALEPGADRGVSGIAGESPEVPPLRLLHAAGCDCGRSCGGGFGPCDRLAADCCALRPIGTNSAVASCTAKSCRGNCNARWSRDRSGAYRRGLGTWRIGKLLPGAFSPCRYVPQAGQDR